MEALYDGEKVQDKVTILLTAANGLTSEQVLVIDILVNDAPVAAGAAGIGSTLTLGSSIPSTEWGLRAAQGSVWPRQRCGQNDHLSYSVVGVTALTTSRAKSAFRGLFGTLNSTRIRASSITS